MVLVTLRDVTELRCLEQTKNDYLHMVSHDLRSPLAVVLSHAQLLGLIARDSRICNSAQAIATSSLRMSNMITDLVDSTRLESGQMVLKTTSLDVERLIRDFLLRMQGVMETERIQVIGGDPLPLVIADPDRLERIFTNFISNALKYSPKETTVEVSFRVEEAWLVVAIRDQGRGIKTSDVPFVFDRFFRVRSLGEEGIGLGLYIAKNLVEAHRGKVWAESTLGVGSTFFFTLPLADQTEPVIPATILEMTK
jgi:signal transduction histidine kinase